MSRESVPVSTPGEESQNRRTDPQRFDYGQIGLEFKLRPFSAGSILTLRNRIEPLASTTSLARTPQKML